MVRRWARLLLSVVVLVPSACSPPPDEVTTGGSGSSDTSAGTITVTPDTTAATTRPVEDSSGTPPSETGVDTTLGAVESTTGEAGDGSSSSGPPPGCMGPDDCNGNQICEDGRCVDACGGAWGEGSYGYCVTEYGDFNTAELCGPDHLCVYWGDPIEQTACALQGCVDACDCPAPPETGDATVTCEQITAEPDLTDCYLSCERGEACPDDMTCGSSGVCVTDAPEVPIYGDCGNLAPGCAAPGFCIVTPPGNQTQCTMTCLVPGDCPVMAPAGGDATMACSDVSPSTLGFECYLSCIGGLTCPDGMVCVNGTLCGWPD